MTATARDEEPMAQLLSEALRRGPGSPEWHAALSLVGDGDKTRGDDVGVLLRARERLAGGAEWGTVRAGPAFTHAVMSGIDAPPPTRSRWGRVVAWTSAAIVVASVVALGVLTYQSRDDASPEALARRLFIAPLHQYSFLEPAAAGFEIDKNWHIDRLAGLRPAASGDVLRLELPKPLDLTTPVCVECVIDVQRASDGRIALIAVDEKNTAVEIELARGGVRAVGGNETLRLRKELRPGTHVLRLKLARGAAIAEVDGKSVWAGPAMQGGTARLAIEFRNVTRDVTAARVEAVRVLGVAPNGGRP